MKPFTPESLPFLALPWKRLQDRKDLPNCAAIYFVCDANSRVLYIGRATRLSQRCMSHNRLPQCRTIAQCRIAWLEVTEPALLQAIEEACIAYFCPPWNGHAEPGALTTTKITPEALRLLQQIAERLGEKQYGTLTRLLTREWERLHRAALKES